MYRTLNGHNASRVLREQFQTNLECVSKYDYEVLQLQDKVWVITV